MWADKIQVHCAELQRYPSGRTAWTPSLSSSQFHNGTLVTHLYWVLVSVLATNQGHDLELVHISPVQNNRGGDTPWFTIRKIKTKTYYGLNEDILKWLIVVGPYDVFGLGSAATIRSYHDSHFVFA